LAAREFKCLPSLRLSKRNHPSTPPSLFFLLHELISLSRFLLSRPFFHRFFHEMRRRTPFPFVSLSQCRGIVFRTLSLTIAVRFSFSLFGLLLFLTPSWPKSGSVYRVNRPVLFGLLAAIRSLSQTARFAFDPSERRLSKPKLVFFSEPRQPLLFVFLHVDDRFRLGRCSVWQDLLAVS